MPISEKQIVLVNKLYQTQKINNETVSKFLSRKLGRKVINIFELNHSDISLLLNNNTLSESNKRFLDELLTLTGIKDVTITTKGDLDKFVKSVELEYPDIFIPKKINFKNYNYIIQSKTDDYILGEQFNIYKNTKMNVLCFFNLMVLDWDNVTLEEIKEILKDSNETFMIYKTYNGFHGYCVSNFYNHNSLYTIQKMRDLQCDPIYISFVYYTGYVVRLSKKLDRKEEFIEKYIGTIGTKQVVPKLVELVHFKNSLLGIE